MTDRLPFYDAPDTDTKPTARSAGVKRIASGCAVALVAGWLILIGGFLLTGIRFFWLRAG